MKKTPDPPSNGFVPNKYRIPLKQAVADWQLEQTAFRLGWPEERGGLGKFEHCKRYWKLLWPELKWNDWLERMLAGFCNEKYAFKLGDTIIRVVVLVGPAGAGKTFVAGQYVFGWWLADPTNSIGILTSTTKGAIGQRVWPVIENAYHQARRNLAENVYHIPEEEVILGNMISSQKMLQANKGDAKHAIFAQAVKEGETSKAEAFIRGQHAPRICVVIDEAGDTPPAIYSVVSNLRKACQDLTVIVIDNAVSRLNAHGRCCTPKGGWGQRPVGKVEWATEGVLDWQLEAGVCLQFRGADSPNVKAGRTIHPYIYTWEDYQLSLRPGVRNTLSYWKYDAGEWAPDGVCSTVFNETMAIQNGLQDGVLWLDKPEGISFHDPGFGGDAAIQCCGKFGSIDDGKGGSIKAVLVEEMLELELNADERDESGKLVDYEHQLARQIIHNCGARGIPPRNFGLYSTGTGRGVASVLYTDWSDAVLKVEEGGLPSELPASESDPRPAKEVYDRRVTELWFSAKSFADGRQLRGVDSATLIELCTREYDTTGKPWKYRMETKDEFRPKLGHSPDRGDSLCGLCWLVRIRFGVAGGGEAKIDPDTDWNKRVEESQEPDVDPAYSAENERELVMDDGGYEDYGWRQ